MKKTNDAIDWKAPKTGTIEVTPTGHRVKWFNGEYETFESRSRKGRAKLKELWYGKLRYEVGV